MLDHLVGDWVLLLFKLPIGNLVVASLAGLAPTVTSLPAFWLSGLGLTPCLALLVKGIMVLFRTALTPGYGILFK